MTCSTPGLDVAREFHSLLSSLAVASYAGLKVFEERMENDPRFMENIGRALRFENQMDAAVRGRMEQAISCANAAWELIEREALRGDH